MAWLVTPKKCRRRNRSLQIRQQNWNPIVFVSAHGEWSQVVSPGSSGQAEKRLSPATTASFAEAPLPLPALAHALGDCSLIVTRRISCYSALTGDFLSTANVFLFLRSLIHSFI